MVRSYESMMIIRGDVTGEELEAVFKKISTRIEEADGTVSGARIWARDKVFMYPLRSRAAGKKKYNKGCYWLVNFTLDTEKLKELKETIRLEENILRSLIIRTDAKEE